MKSCWTAVWMVLLVGCGTASQRVRPEAGETDSRVFTPRSSAEPVELAVEPLPCWNRLGETERQRAVREWVEAVESEARAQDKPVLGARAVSAQQPHTRPEHLKRSPRPLGHASTRQALKELRGQYRTFVAAFREAAARWRRGDFLVIFPRFSFPPRVVPNCVTRILCHPLGTPSRAACRAELRHSNSLTPSRTPSRRLNGGGETSQFPFRPSPSHLGSCRVA